MWQRRIHCYYSNDVVSHSYWRVWSRLSARTWLDGISGTSSGWQWVACSCDRRVCWRRLTAIVACDVSHVGATAKHHNSMMTDRQLMTARQHYTRADLVKGLSRVGRMAVQRGFKGLTHCMTSQNQKWSGVNLTPLWPPSRSGEIMSLLCVNFIFLQVLQVRVKECSKLFGWTGAPHFRGPTRAPEKFMRSKLPINKSNENISEQTCRTYSLL